MSDDQKHGQFVDAATDRDEAYAKASEFAERLAKIGAKGFLVGVRTVHSSLFYVELWRSPGGAIIFPRAAHTTESDPELGHAE